ncbi:MAG: hypothetical protein AAF927_01820 [Bacteroidota bacterium]
MKNSLPNYQLDHRFKKLPGHVQKLIKRDFDALPGSSTTRWYRIMHNVEFRDLRAHECLAFMDHTGCTLLELLDPSEDLFNIYIKRVYEKEESEKANLYGLEKNAA